MKHPIQAKLWRRSAVIILFPLILLTVLIPALAHHPPNYSELSDTANPGPQIPRTTILSPSQDNTLYEDATGSLSNGAGQHFIVGTTALDPIQIRRGLIAFDLSSAISSGSTVLSATLILSMSRTIAGTQPVALHPVLAEWGEGTSDADGAGGDEGIGTAATPGDATWLHTFYDNSLWIMPGGDFAAAASATTLVGGLGSYQWSSPQIATDVQAWIDTPADNFGWLLLGNETTTSAKRFDSRENPTEANRPVLVITYEPPPFDFHVYLPSVTSTTTSE
jgi:hypothetical protein